MDSSQVHVILDSNIFYQDLWMRGIYFKILTKLCRDRDVILHLPFIVEQEVIAKEKEVYRELLTNLRSSTKKMPTNVLDDVFGISSFSDIEKRLGILGNGQADETTFSQWLLEIGAKKHPLDMQQTELAVKAYFEGGKPLKSPKVRDDIPDSFIFQCIKTVHVEMPEIHFVSNDKALSKAVSSVLDPKKCYKSLKEFIDYNFKGKYDEEQLLLKLVPCLQNYEHEITQRLNSRLYGELEWRGIDDDPPGGEERNSCISGVGDVAEDKVQFQFEEIDYYGDDQVLLPFIVEEMEVYITYYIFKSDYWGMENPPSVSDHNKHYFEAESDFTVRVNGLMTISVDSEAFDDMQIPDFDDVVMDITVGEIQSIKLLYNFDEMM